jgi:hypothetical protein
LVPGVRADARCRSSRNCPDAWIIFGMHDVGETDDRQVTLIDMLDRLYACRRRESNWVWIDTAKRIAGHMRKR